VEKGGASHADEFKKLCNANPWVKGTGGKLSECRAQSASSRNHPDPPRGKKLKSWSEFGDAALLAIMPLSVCNAHAVRGSIQQHVRAERAHIARYMFPSVHVEDAIDTSGPL
jgi:hypothetical protein